MAGEAGKAYVDIKPDLSGFGSRLTAGIMRPLQGAERSLTGGLTKSFKTAGILAAGALGVGALAGSVKSLVSIGIEYDKTLSIFKSVTQASAAEMDKARATALNLGNALDLPGVSAAGAASAMTELAKAGLSTQQSIDAARGALQLSIAAQTSEAQAASITANALLTFGLNAKEAGRVTDLLAGAANASSASMTDIAYALAMGGTAAKSAKVPIQDTITALTLLANAGIKGSDAGTLLKTALQRMTAPTKTAAKTMKGLGLNFFTSKGEFVGMRSAVDQLQKRLGPLNTAQRAAALSTIFGADASRFASIMADQGTKSWDKYAAQVGRSGQAAQLAAAQNTGLGGALDNLQSTAEGLGLRLYGVLQPAFTSVVKGITTLVSNVPSAIKAIGSFVKGIVASKAGQFVIAQLTATFNNVKAVIPALVATFGNLVRIVKTLVPIILPVAAAIGGALLVGIRGLSTVLPPVAAALASVTGFLADNMDAVLTITGAIGAFVAILYIQKGITLGVAAVQKAWAAATLLVRGAILSAQVAMWLLNAAIAANPIGIAIAAIAALVVGFVILYKRNAAFRALVQKVWAAIKTAIGATIGWITGTAVPAIVGAWNWIINGVKGIWTAVTTTFNNVMSAIGRFISLLVAIGVRIILIWTYPYRLAFAIIIGIFFAIGKAILPPLMAFIGRVVAGWQRIVNFTVSIFNTVRAFIAGVFAAIYNTVAPIVAAVVAFVVGRWNNLLANISRVVNVIRAVVTTVFNGIRAVVTAVVGRIRSAVAAAFNALVGIVSGPVNRVRSVVATAFNNTVSAITGAVGRVRSAASRIGQTILDAITGFVGRMAGIGGNIVSGLIGGITGMAGTLRRNVTAFINDNVPAPVRKLLHIGSPSKLFAEIGRFTAQGLSIGLSDEARRVAAASRTLAAATMDGYNATLTPPSVAGYQSFRPGSVPNPTQASSNVRVYIGDRELTDIVKVEVDGAQDNLGRQLTYGRRA